MRAALFEDNDTHAENIIKMVESWAEKSGKKVVVTRFRSAFEAKELSLFDCLLLDVEMPGMNGVDLARETRSNGNRVPIVFISSHTEYSIDGYEVSALRFIDKNSPELERKVFECMDKTSYEIENSLNAYYSIKDGRKLFSIPMCEIMFFEVLDHDLITHTVTGTFRERKTISELKKELPKQFVQIGRSHVVNVLHVSRITAKAATLRDGTALSIAPKYSTVLYESFLEMR